VIGIVLLIIYLIVIYMGGVMLATFWAISDPYDTNSICLFWFPQWRIRDQKEDLNTAEYILVSVFSNIIFAPSTVLAILFIGLSLIPTLIGSLFKKKEK
jgi:hypothetical protein